MRRAIISCLLIAVLQTVLMGGETEVEVLQGKVRGRTPKTDITISAGKKVLIKEEHEPIVAVDDPLVDDALELYKFVEAERAHGDLKIDSVFVVVGKADEEGVVAAIYWEVPNPMPQATNIMTIPNSSTLGDIKVYDLSGNLCKVEQKSLGNFAFSFSIHFAEQVQPGESFKFIAVTSLGDIDLPVFPGGVKIAWKEGPLNYFRASPGYPNALQYFRFIMPESAILVDTNREIVATDTVDGKPAVTIRNYTGPYSDAMCMIALLNPAEDGTSPADIPGKYRGLRSKRDKENSEMYQREMHKIRAGMKHTDRSTPLAAFLTGFSSAINGDADLYKAVAYGDLSPDRIQWGIENSKYWADQVDLLSTPQWPRNPGNGYVHPIYLCRKGSLINELVQRMVHEDGKWHSNDGKWIQPVDYEHATSEDIGTAKSKGYLCDWEVAGPYIQKGKKYNELHDIPFGPEIPGVDVMWLPTTILSDEKHPVLVNIGKSIMQFNDSVAYLRTEITSDTQKPARLEIYTDDGVKAWLNGKLIHENNVGRGIPDKPDVVNVTLKQGVNRLMLKVTEYVMGSQAIVRLAEP